MRGKKICYRISIWTLAAVILLLLFLIVVVVPPDWVFTMLGWIILPLSLFTGFCYLAGWSE